MKVFDEILNAEEVYFGVKKCGCAVAVVTIVESLRDETAQSVADFIENGLLIERGKRREVAGRLQNCPHEAPMDTSFHKGWLCDKCQDTHDSKIAAALCCASISEVFICSDCEEEYETKEQATVCCLTPEKAAAQQYLELEVAGQQRMFAR